jgi:DNA polymerase-4
MMADTTCCIAASYEAKAFGVRTGTIVADAKRMCPEIVLVEARHEVYVDYHRRIVEAVESCLPVSAVLSIDEMACRLMGRERPLLAAMELGRKVKARILDQVGPMLRSSVGLATNRYLAKIASDMEKPDGLIALPIDLLPEALGLLTLRDLPGIGAKTEKRLNEKGITTMKQLLALSCEQSGELWGSVWGERLWHWLRGEDFDMAETDHLKSISHSHVLAPEMRTAEKAWAVAHKLLHKAAMRLRAGGLWASSIGLAVGFAVPRGEKVPVSRFGVPTRGWHHEIRLSECRDNPTLIAALSRLWASRPSGKEYDQPYFIGVQLNGLVPDRLHSLNLFDGSEDEQSRTRLLEVMDQLNNKYGMSTLARPPCSPPTKPPPPASPSTASPTSSKGCPRSSAGLQAGCPAGVHASSRFVLATDQKLCPIHCAFLAQWVGVRDPPSDELFPPKNVTLCIPASAPMRIRR